MVVGYLDLEGVAIFPMETDAPLVVYANGILALAIPFQGFESVRWRIKKFRNIQNGIENPKFVKCSPLNILWKSLNKLPTEDDFGVFVSKVDDHYSE
jgi:hypothetical protein